MTHPSRNWQESGNKHINQGMDNQELSRRQVGSQAQQQPSYGLWWCSICCNVGKRASDYPDMYATSHRAPCLTRMYSFIARTLNMHSKKRLGNRLAVRHIGSPVKGCEARGGVELSE